MCLMFFLFSYLLSEIEQYFNQRQYSDSKTKQTSSEGNFFMIKNIYKKTLILYNA